MSLPQDHLCGCLKASAAVAVDPRASKLGFEQL